MTLASGDPIRYRALKEGPVGDYLLALDNFVPTAPKPAEQPTEQAKPSRQWQQQKR